MKWWGRTRIGRVSTGGTVMGDEGDGKRTGRTIRDDVCFLETEYWDDASASYRTRRITGSHTQT